MKELLLDAFKDSIKLFPFLFITFLILEIIEHKFNKKQQNLIKQSQKLGPIIGSILGAFPQCGFSSAASNLYAAKIISLGTLISIYLSTSDEMLPLLISEQIDPKIIITIISIKIIIGIIFGLLIDFIRKNKKENINIKQICKEEHCHCQDNILKSSLTHSLHILIYIFIINLILNFTIETIGLNKLSNLLNNNSIISPLIASLIGLIPNCASSVLLTKLYIANIISLGTLVAGLLTGSGVGLLILFKVNNNKKENIKITFLLYLIGILCGIILNL